MIRKSVSCVLGRRGTVWLIEFEWGKITLLPSTSPLSTIASQLGLLSSGREIKINLFSQNGKGAKIERDTSYSLTCLESPVIAKEEKTLLLLLVGL